MEKRIPFQQDFIFDTGSIMPSTELVQDSPVVLIAQCRSCNIRGEELFFSPKGERPVISECPICCSGGPFNYSHSRWVKRTTAFRFKKVCCFIPWFEMVIVKEAGWEEIEHE